MEPRGHKGEGTGHRAGARNSWEVGPDIDELVAKNNKLYAENEKLKEENKALKQYMDNWRETMKTVNEGTSEITANLYGILDGHYKLQ